MSAAQPSGNTKKVAAFRRSLLRWYDANRRDLPWRETSDPYSIWVSEIMLQQTRVAAVLEHYRNWLKLFPTVKALASAPLDRVLAAWSGLGYYRRARMLHQAAQELAENSAGVIPRTAAELRKLPGVGRYTAAAIASIAFGEAQAVVDGNVQRVLSRIGGGSLMGEPLWAEAQRLLDSRRPGDWNQAIMELGATVCVPFEPACHKCPLRRNCQLRGAEPARKQAPRHRKTVHYELRLREREVYLVKRGGHENKMAGMWELPHCSDSEGKELMRLRHSITNTDYDVRIRESQAETVTSRGSKDLAIGNTGTIESGQDSGQWFDCEQVRTLALTGLTRKVLLRQGLLSSK